MVYMYSLSIKENQFLKPSFRGALGGGEPLNVARRKTINVSAGRLSACCVRGKGSMSSGGSALMLLKIKSFKTGVWHTIPGKECAAEL